MTVCATRVRVRVRGLRDAKTGELARRPAIMCQMLLIVFVNMHTHSAGGGWHTHGQEHSTYDWINRDTQ